MGFLIRAPISLHHMTILICLGYILLDHVDSQTTGSNLSCIASERWALLNFKSSLVFNSERNLSDWSHENMDCCRWEGIRCSKAGRVVKIDLHCPWNDNLGLGLGLGHIRGEISPSLLHLSYLSYLDLSNNDFTKVPEFFGSLKRLRYLNLSHNPLAGKVPHQLGNLSVLESLDLNMNNLVQYSHVGSLAWISKLSSLNYLDMSTISLQSTTDWLQIISKHPSLKNLYLRFCDLPLPEPVETNASTSLEVVDLSYSVNLNFIALSTWLNASTKLVDLTISTYADPASPIPFPDYLTKMVSLKYLDLSHNYLEGVLPITFCNLSNLISLDLSNNYLGDTLPECLAQLLQRSTNLIKLDVSSNHFYGTLTEALFRNVTNLQVLSLSSNSLTINFGAWFTPPFQLHILKLRACKLGKIFPHWLKTQKNLISLDISDSGISDKIPSWFWNITSRLEYLNLSHNSISGSLPPNSLSSCDFVDLNSNQFHGSLPSFSRTIVLLDVSSNAFSGGITFLCGLRDWSLSYLDLANNYLSGILPNCWKPVQFAIYYLNLNNNNFSGSLSNLMMGSLSSLMSLRLRKNSFTGNLPQFLEECTNLNLLDLGENQFSGVVPEWIGTSLSDLTVVRLDGNEFEGNIPSTLCHLNNIQILDLSFNNISGHIPPCFNNFTAMVDNRRAPNSYFIPGGYVEDGYVTEISSLYSFRAWVFWKGLQVEFKSAKTIELLKLIDLSSNRLSGLVPEELTSLVECIVLNLSHNVLIGPIPNKIGQMRMLESLDLSHNRLSGEIPVSITNLSTLSYLDLSYNNVTGSIPVSTQLTTFDAAMFKGNLGLCGPPLPNPCRRGENVETDLSNAVGGDDNDNMWMYISIGVGFIVGFWGVCGTLIIKKSWAEVYFQCLTHIKERLHVAFIIGLANLRTRFASSTGTFNLNQGGNTK